MTSSTHSSFLDSPVLEAELVRTEWGDYKATLILPDGHQETLSGDHLDAVRQRVIGVAGGYLRGQVGHPGRLRVQDPDGTWLLGVPLDNSDLIPLTASTISPPAAAAAAAATRLLPRPPARPAGFGPRDASRPFCQLARVSTRAVLRRPARAAAHAPSADASPRAARSCWCSSPSPRPSKGPARVALPITPPRRARRRAPGRSAPQP